MEALNAVKETVCVEVWVALLKVTLDSRGHMIQGLHLEDLFHMLCLTFTGYHN